MMQEEDQQAQMSNQNEKATTWNAAFDAYDLNSDGVIDKIEFTAALEKILKTKLSDEQIERLYYRIGVNGEDLIGYEQFEKFMTKTLNPSCEIDSMAAFKGVLLGKEARKLQQTIPYLQGKGDFLQPGSGLLVYFKSENDNIDYIVRGRRFCGRWKLTVGGAVEEGETFLEAAFREFGEEHFKYQIGEPKVIPDIAYLDRKRKTKGDETVGYDYVTSQAVVMIESKEILKSYVPKLKAAALAALAALSAVDIATENESRSQLAADALSHGQFISQLIKEPLGQQVLIYLQDLQQGKHINLEADVQSEVESTIKVFTEYSDFDIVEAREILKSVKAKDQGLFAPELPVVLELLTSYLEG